MTVPAMDRFRNEESGLTLTELMVTVALLVVVIAAFLTFVEAVNRGVTVQAERSRANDQVRLAMERLDREVRSANFIYNPQDETSPFQSLRIYTQANYTTRTPGFQCVQWRIEGGELLRRSWPTGQPGSASAWRMHAEDIVNADLDEAAFKMDSENINRTVEVTLFVDVDPDDPVSSPVRLETSLTGRNVPSGYTDSVCNPPPPEGGDDDDD